MTAAELLETGTLEHVATVARRLTGVRPSPATIWRWCRKGLRSGTVKLDCVYHSGMWQTTDAAFQRFVDRQTESALATSGGASDEELEAAGLL